MALATNYIKEELASEFAQRATHVSLHTTDPGTTGVGEVTGGTPAYARRPITWIAGTADGVYTSSPVDFDVPASTTIVFAGLWTAATGGTFIDKSQVNATYSAQGVLRVTVVYTQS